MSATELNPKHHALSCRRCQKRPWKAEMGSKMANGARRLRRLARYSQPGRAENHGCLNGILVMLYWLQYEAGTVLCLPGSKINEDARSGEPQKQVSTDVYVRQVWNGVPGHVS